MRTPKTLLILLLALPLTACPGPPEEPEAEPELAAAAAAPADPALLRLPPLARRAGLKLLDQESRAGNALLVVEFEPDRRPKGRELSVHLSERPTVLRDDGQGGDETAGDGFFSGVVRVDPRELRAERERNLKAAAAGPTPLFRGRERVGTTVAEPLRGERALLRRPQELPILDRRPRERVQRVQFPDAELRKDAFLPILPIPGGIFVSPSKSLFINDPGVVTDPTRTFNPCTNVGNPNGVWTFGHLMTQLANQPATGIAPPDFAREWVKKWTVNQTVNGWPVANRNVGIQSQIIGPWQAASGGGANPLNLTKAPFRLLAIVNRVDLRQNLVYGGGSAGEARFIFGAVNLQNNCQPLRFTVIFEYGIRKPHCFALRAWGKQWFDLKVHALGSPAYNTALQAITDQFTTAGSNPAQLPNRSSLNQLRTNEIALASPWELREFRLAGAGGPAPGHLAQVTVKQSPGDPRNKQPVVANYINANAPAILLSAHSVPDQFPPGVRFLGGASQVPFPPNTFFWDGPPPAPSAAIVTPNSRHMFSLNTCGACHGGETATFFTHIDPVAPPPAPLSGFLTGIAVLDPAGEGVTRNFNDLWRRRQDLWDLVHQSCFPQLFFDPLRMVH